MFAIASLRIKQFERRQIVWDVTQVTCHAAGYQAPRKVTHSGVDEDMVQPLLTEVRKLVDSHAKDN